MIDMKCLKPGVKKEQQDFCRSLEEEPLTDAEWSKKWIEYEGNPVKFLVEYFNTNDFPKLMNQFQLYGSGGNYDEHRVEKDKFTYSFVKFVWETVIKEKKPADYDEMFDPEFVRTCEIEYNKI